MTEAASILGSNLTAVDAISAKLAEVAHLAEKLDARLCEAGARTRSVSIPAAVTSSASSLLSISVASSSGAPVHKTSITSTPVATLSTATATNSKQPPFSGTAFTIIKSDVIKPIRSMAETSDESLLHIRSHLAQNVEATNKDSNKVS